MSNLKHEIVQRLGHVKKSQRLNPIAAVKSSLAASKASMSF